MSYERSARYYDLFDAKDDGAFLAELAARPGGRLVFIGMLHIAAGDEQAIYVFKQKKRPGGRLEFIAPLGRAR